MDAKKKKKELYIYNGDDINAFVPVQWRVYREKYSILPLSKKKFFFFEKWQILFTIKIIIKRITRMKKRTTAGESWVYNNN